ncbi:MAG: cell division protein FtsQ/DivIB [Candidatus Peregrinibacteria bacterium]|nr:cell division protein FtsQ/DivIB [Candidatus Peregrinibacteria bacterium]
MIFKRKKQTGSTFSRRTTRLRPRKQRSRSPFKKKAPSTQQRRTDRRKQAGRRGVKSLWTTTRRPLLLSVVGGIIIAITHFLFISTTLNITQVEVFEDGKSVDNHPIETFFREFEGSNILLLNLDDITPYIIQKYDQYAIIDVQKNLPDTLVINLETFPVVANVIVEIPDEKELYYSLSSSGQVNEIDSENSDLPTLLIQAEQTLPEGTQIITLNELAFTLEAIQNYEDKFGMEVIYALYFETEREVHLWTEREFYVWLDLTADLDEQLNKLKKALPQLNIYEEELEYIDLRIPGITGEKIIFKRR